MTEDYDKKRWKLIMWIITKYSQRHPTVLISIEARLSWSDISQSRFFLFFFFFTILLAYTTPQVAKINTAQKPFCSNRGPKLRHRSLSVHLLGKEIDFANSSQAALQTQRRVWSSPDIYSMYLNLIGETLKDKGQERENYLWPECCLSLALGMTVFLPQMRSRKRWDTEFISQR